MKDSLGPPIPPLQDFLVTVCVVHGSAGKPGSSWPEPSSIGFFQTLGCRVRPERLKGFLQAQIQVGAIDWQRTEWDRVVLDELDEEIRARVTPLPGEGIWYSSGRMYFDHD